MVLGEKLLFFVTKFIVNFLLLRQKIVCLFNFQINSNVPIQLTLIQENNHKFSLKETSGLTKQQTSGVFGFGFVFF